MPPSVLLVIPAFRESRRLPKFLPALCEALTAIGMPEVQVQVVDDGSGEEEQARMRQVLEEVRTRHPFVRPLVALPQNVGKGGAIYCGWDEAVEEEWLAFVDADGAVPAPEVARILSLTQDPAAAGRAIYAVRVTGAGHHVRRTLPRWISGRVFRWLVHFLFEVQVPDTQCGCKVVPREVYRRLRPRLSELRFAFDVELTLRLQNEGCEILPVPIDWHESPGGRVRPRTVVEMVASLLRLRRQLNSEGLST